MLTRAEVSNRGQDPVEREQCMDRYHLMWAWASGSEGMAVHEATHGNVGPQETQVVERPGEQQHQSMASQMETSIPLVEEDAAVPVGTNLEFEVEAILRKYVRAGSAMYYVKWKGLEECTWESEHHLLNYIDMVRQFDIGDETDTGLFRVNKICGKRRRNRKVQYLVDWQGYTEADRTWEPLQNLSGCKRAVADYNRRMKQNEV